MNCMFKKMIKNRKGTAEVIGSIMFIVILLFFFTNVYLWHDAATKEMNDIYVEKINSPIKVTISADAPYELTVTNVGGQAATLNRLWVDEKTGSGVVDHRPFDLGNIVVRPGLSEPINLAALGYSPEGKTVVFEVVSTVGNMATCYYPPPPS